MVRVDSLWIHKTKQDRNNKRFARTNSVASEVKSHRSATANQSSPRCQSARALEFLFVQRVMRDFVMRCSDCERSHVRLINVNCIWKCDDCLWGATDKYEPVGPLLSEILNATQVTEADQARKTHRQCVGCRIDTGELYWINSRYVCLSCIANDGWFNQMAADRAAAGVS